MAIYTMEGIYSMNGLGSGLGLTPAEEAMYSQAIRGSGLGPQTRTVLPPSNSTLFTLEAPSFLDTWGIPIAAGAGTFLLGLAIAKFATSRKKKR